MRWDLSRECFNQMKLCNLPPMGITDLSTYSNITSSWQPSWGWSDLSLCPYGYFFPHGSTLLSHTCDVTGRKEGLRTEGVVAVQIVKTIEANLTWLFFAVSCCIKLKSWSTLSHLAFINQSVQYWIWSVSYQSHHPSNPPRRLFSESTARWLAERIEHRFQCSRCWLWYAEGTWAEVSCRGQYSCRLMQMVSEVTFRTFTNSITSHHSFRALGAQLRKGLYRVQRFRHSRHAGV